MSVSDQSSRSPARIVLVVLLAAGFLAVIGASVGYIAAQRHSTTDAGANGDGDDGGNDGGSGGNGSGTDNANTTSPPGGGGSSTRAEPRPCLDVTEKAARDHGSPGGLVQLLYIDTALSEVWICRDSANKLWYQGHRKSTAERNGASREPLVDGENSLFLSTIERRGPTSYVATNVSNQGTTRYLVSEQELVIDNGPGNQQHQPVLHREVWTG
jgi:hypothetical protein